MFIEKEDYKIPEVRRTGMTFKGDQQLWPSIYWMNLKLNMMKNISSKECNRNASCTIPVLRTSNIHWYFLCYKHTAPTALSDAGQIIGSSALCKMRMIDRPTDPATPVLFTVTRSYPFSLRITAMMARAIAKKRSEGVLLSRADIVGIEAHLLYDFMGNC
jgi:hypothetical protein